MTSRLLESFVRSQELNLLIRLVRTSHGYIDSEMKKNEILWKGEERKR